MFGPLAKWVAQIERVDRIPELIARAYTTACAGRPGPVVLALPEDLLVEETDVPDAPRFRVVQPSPAESDIESLRGLLARSERPFAIIGGAGWTARASDDIRVFLEANDIPAGAAFRRQDTLDNDSPSYAGDVGIGINPALAERVRSADLLLAVGPRLGEMTTSGYTLLDVPKPQQTLVHVHPGAEELGRVYQADLPILSGMERFAAAVRDLRVEARLGCGTRGGPRRLRGVAAARADARRGRSRRVHRTSARSRAGCDRHERRRQPHRVDPPLLAFPLVPEPARADERRDGLRRARRRRRQGNRTGAHRRLPGRVTASS